MDGAAIRQRKARVALVLFAAAFSACAIWAAWPAAAAQKPQLLARNTVGRVSRYELQSRAVTTGETTTPIANPEGGSKFTETVHLLLTLKSLEPKVLPDGSRAERFLATFDQALRDSDSDALDLSASSADDPFATIAGHAVQYAVVPDGRLQDIEGLEELFRDKALAQPVLEWLPQFSAATRLPAKPVAVGEKWKNEHPVANMPFDDLVWRSDSEYLRDEPCKLYVVPGAANGSDAAQDGDCAIVLTRFQISRHGSSSSDATPADYLHNGLRTSGKWSGSGESLDSISLARGVLVSSTQTSSQDVDFVIKSAATGSSIHRQGHTETSTQITLLPASP